MNGRHVTIACLVRLRRSEATRTTRPNDESARAAVADSAPLAGTMLDAGTNTARPSSLRVNRTVRAKLSSYVPGWFVFDDNTPSTLTTFLAIVDENPRLDRQLCWGR